MWARSRRRARSPPRASRLDGPRRARHHRDRADAAGGLSRAAQLGLRRRSAVRTRAELRHARGAEAFRRRRARARDDGAARRRLQPLRPGRQLPARSTAPQFFTDGDTTRHGAPRSTSTARQPHGARLLRPQRAVLARGVPLRRAAARCSACNLRRQSTQHIVSELATRAARRAGPRAPRASRAGERPQRSALSRARPTHGRAALADAQWNDDVHHALHVLSPAKPTATTPTTPTQPVRAAGALRSPKASYTRASPRRSVAAAPRGEPSGHLPPQAFVTFLQNHDQIGNRALGERLSMLADARAAATRPMPPAAVAARADAVHGRGVRRAARLSCLLRLRPRAGRRGHPRPAQRIRPLRRLSRRSRPRAHPRPQRSIDLRSQQAALGGTRCSRAMPSGWP